MHEIIGRHSFGHRENLIDTTWYVHATMMATPDSTTSCLCNLSVYDWLSIREHTATTEALFRMGACNNNNGSTSSVTSWVYATYGGCLYTIQQIALIYKKAEILVRATYMR